MSPSRLMLWDISLKNSSGEALIEKLLGVGVCFKNL